MMRHLATESLATDFHVFLVEGRRETNDAHSSTQKLLLACPWYAQNGAGPQYERNGLTCSSFVRRTEQGTFSSGGANPAEWVQAL